MNRKEYWSNNYLKYWQERVAEANEDNGYSKIIKGDKITDSNEEYLNAIELLSPENDSSILELGCGFGRSLPYLYNISKNITAIDISDDMVSEAKKNYSNLEEIKYFVSDAESTPLASKSFLYVICYAVFDALYQDKALVEINRLLEKDGYALISGKNDNYNNDDELAFIAEVNARKKNHPNYFTNINLLLDGEIEKFGFCIEEIRFYERRGDTSGNNYKLEKPDFFYEYIMKIKKIKDIGDIKIKISDKYSKTYHRIAKEKL